VEDASRPGFLAAHLQYVRTRTPSEADRFAELMLRWAWPEGHEDRFDPDAAEWPEWAPVRGPATQCGCRAGRCTLCN
jgi:hypothetical protein